MVDVSLLWEIVKLPATGLIAFLVGINLEKYKENRSKKQATNYGIKILYPRGATPKGNTSVTGTYDIQPPTGELRLFLVGTGLQDPCEWVWPLEIVQNFDTVKRTWHADVWIGDNAHVVKDTKIVAALTGQPSKILWNYCKKIRGESEGWNFDGWPNDSIRCDENFIVVD